MSNEPSPAHGRQFQRVVQALYHEVTSIPVTFAASIIVIVGVAYSALDFLFHLQAPQSGSVPSLPSLPIVGLDFLVRSCAFLVLQSALAFVYAKTQNFVSEKVSRVAFLIWIMVALIFGWLSTFVSVALFALSGVSYDWAVIRLFLASLVGIFIMGFFVDAYQTDKEDYQSVAPFSILFGLIALIIFGVIFGTQVLTSLPTS